MGLYYLTYKRKLIRLLKKRWIPGVYADGNDYYDAYKLFPEDNADSDIFTTVVTDPETILEFADDDSARLWFVLEYGLL